MPDRSSEFSIARVLAVAIPLLVIASFVVQYTEVYRPGPSTDLAIFHGLTHVPVVPPAMVYGLFVPLLLLCAASSSLRRRWRVTRGELVVVFCMLFLAVPIFGIAFWHQFVSTQLTRLNWDMPNLWPNRGNVLEGASAEDDSVVEGFHWTIDPPVEPVVVQTQDGPQRCVKIVHTSPSAVSTITLEVNRSVASSRRAGLRRAEQYWVFARVRLDDADLSTKVRLKAGIEPGKIAEFSQLAASTPVSAASPYRFTVLGSEVYQVPAELGDQWFLQLQFTGSGTVYVHNFSMYDTGDVAHRYLEGYKQASPQVYDALPVSEQVGVWRRPESWWQRSGYELFGRVPWRSWARPFGVWGLLVVGTFGAMFCLITIFYRQWEDGDGMTFPLQTFLLDLTRAGERGQLALWRSKPFWIGGGLGFIYLSLQQLNAYFEDIPAIHLRLSIPDLLPSGGFKDAVAGAGRGLVVDIRPAFVAVAFLMSLEMSMSLVVFFWIGLLLRLVGFFTPLRTMRIAAGNYGGGSYPFDGLFMLGGLLFLAVYCLWAARKHLLNVLRHVLAGKGPLDDSKEAMSYRSAMIGLILSAGLIVWFALAANLNPVFVCGWMVFLLLMAISAARIRAETGLPYLSLLPMVPYSVLVALGGALAFGYRQVIFTSRAAFLYMGAFLMLAPILAECMGAATRAGVPLRKLGRCLLIGFVIAMVLGGVVYLSWSYTHGAANMNTAATRTFAQFDAYYTVQREELMVAEYFRDHPDEPPLLTPEMRERVVIKFPGMWVFAGISFAITGLLSLARVIWLGFPLHPLGFALAFSPAIYELWPSIAAGHLIKRFGLRMGGMALIPSVLRPFAVGLFVGDLCTVAFWRVLGSLVM